MSGEDGFKVTVGCFKLRRFRQLISLRSRAAACNKTTCYLHLATVIQLPTGFPLLPATCILLLLRLPTGFPLIPATCILLLFRLPTGFSCYLHLATFLHRRYTVTKKPATNCCRFQVFTMCTVVRVSCSPVCIAR